MKIKMLFAIGIIIFVFIIICNSNVSYASGISDVITGGDNFLSAADDSQQVDEDKLKETSNMVYKVLMVLGISIAVIVAGILGIKFMIGSVEEKAQVKDQLVPFIIGCIVIFGAFSIWSIVVNIGNSIESTSGLTSTSTTYTRDDDGTLKCGNCRDVLSIGEQRRGKCSNCDRYIEGL